MIQSKRDMLNISSFFSNSKNPQYEIERQARIRKSNNLILEKLLLIERDKKKRENEIIDHSNLIQQFTDRFDCQIYFQPTSPRSKPILNRITGQFRLQNFGKQTKKKVRIDTSLQIRGNNQSEEDSSQNENTETHTFEVKVNRKVKEQEINFNYQINTLQHYPSKIDQNNDKCIFPSINQHKRRNQFMEAYAGSDNKPKKSPIKKVKKAKSVDISISNERQSDEYEFLPTQFERRLVKQDLLYNYGTYEMKNQEQIEKSTKVLTKNYQRKQSLQYD